jgi:hypothetical protein
METQTFLYDLQNYAHNTSADLLALKGWRAIGCLLMYYVYGFESREKKFESPFKKNVMADL